MRCNCGAPHDDEPAAVIHTRTRRRGVIRTQLEEVAHVGAAGVVRRALRALLALGVRALRDWGLHKTGSLAIL